MGEWREDVQVGLLLAGWLACLLFGLLACLLDCIIALKQHLASLPRCVPAEGCLRLGCMQEGEGKCIYADGSAYDGQWKGGKR